MIFVGLIGIVAFLVLRKNDIYTEPTPIPTEQASTATGCYIATLGKDVYTLSILKEEGENIEGTLSFKNFEKDSSSGTFVGTYKDGILLGDYTFDSEGSRSVMQVIFQKTGEGFVRGFGDVDAETGSRFTDLNKITYDSSYVFKVTPCSE